MISYYTDLTKQRSVIFYSDEVDHKDFQLHFAG